MFKFLASIVLLASASAFLAPASRRASSSLKMNFENALGAQPPLGFWDPLGVLFEADQARFDRLRTVEVKHGRISMLAILGHIVTAAGVRLPGDIAYGLPFADMKPGLGALSSIPYPGIAQIVLFIGLIELGFGIRKDEIEDFCSSKYPDIASEKRKAIELNNGRAAQMGILALMVHEKLDGNPYVINTLIGLPKVEGF